VWRPSDGSPAKTINDDGMLSRPSRGIVMGIGTTSVALFIYFVIFAGGLGTIACGWKVYINSLKG
jgi:hypothetical protein